MNKPKLIIVWIALFWSILILTGCSSSPVNDVQGMGNAGDASTPQEIAEASGLGTIDYVDDNRSTCKKRRHTGSGIRRSTCGKYLDSRPIRSVTADDTSLISSGMRMAGKPGPND